MREIKEITLKSYIQNHKKCYQMNSPLLVAKEVVNYSFRKRATDKDYFMNYQKLCIILFIIYGSTRAAMRIPLLAGGIPYIDSNGYINISYEKLQDYYYKKYDVRKFYNLDDSYNKKSIAKQSRKIIHKICDIFLDKGFVSSTKFISDYKLANLKSEEDYTINQYDFSIPDKNGNRWWNALFGTMTFEEFIKEYTVKVKVKKTGDVTLNDTEKE